MTHENNQENIRTTITSNPTATTTTLESSSSSTNGRNLAQIDMELSEIRDAYQDAINMPMPKSIGKEVRYQLYNGSVHVAYYLYALEETAKAPNPSWRYAQAIVARLVREKVPPMLLLSDPW